MFDNLETTDGVDGNAQLYHTEIGKISMDTTHRPTLLAINSVE